MKPGRAGLLIAAVSLIAVISGSSARADGGIFPPESGTANSADQRAVVIDQGGTQTIILETAYEGDRSDFAWVIPLPSLIQGASITTADQYVFDHLYELTEPRAWVSSGGAAGCGGCGDSGGGAPGGQGEDLAGVNVWETLEVDGYEVVVLSAAESGDLVAWLNDNGFAFPAGEEATLEYYVNKSWYFVALKIAPAEQTSASAAASPAAATAALDPIQMTFPIEAGQLVYPMRISQASSQGETEVLLYVLSGHRMRSSNYATAEVEASSYAAGTDFASWYDARFRSAINDAGGTALIVEYARPFPWGMDDIFDGLLDDSDYFLTRLRTYLTPQQMAEDVKLVSAASDEEFEVSITVARLANLRVGVGIGVLLIAALQAGCAKSRPRRTCARVGALLGLLLLLI